MEPSIKTVPLDKTATYLQLPINLKGRHKHHTTGLTTIFQVTHAQNQKKDLIHRQEPQAAEQNIEHGFTILSLSVVG